MEALYQVMLGCVQAATTQSTAAVTTTVQQHSQQGESQGAVDNASGLGLSYTQWLKDARTAWQRQTVSSGSPADDTNRLLDWLDEVVHLAYARLRSTTPPQEGWAHASAILQGQQAPTAPAVRPLGGRQQKATVRTRTAVLAMITLFEEDAALATVIAFVQHALSTTRQLPTGQWPAIWKRLPSITQRVLCVCASEAVLDLICANPADWGNHAPTIFKSVASYQSLSSPPLVRALARLVTLPHDSPTHHRPLPATSVSSSASSRHYTSNRSATAIAGHLMMHGGHVLVLTGLQSAFPNDVKRAAAVLGDILSQVHLPAAGLVLGDGSWNFAAGNACDWGMLLHTLFKLLQLPPPGQAEDVSRIPTSTATPSPSLSSSLLMPMVAPALEALASTIISSSTGHASNDDDDNADHQYHHHHHHVHYHTILHRDGRWVSTAPATWPWYRLLLGDWLAVEAQRVLGPTDPSIMEPESAAAPAASTAPPARTAADAAQASSTACHHLQDLIVCMAVACHHVDVDACKAAMQSALSPQSKHTFAFSVKALVGLLARIFQHSPARGSELAVGVLGNMLESPRDIPAALTLANTLWNMSAFFHIPRHHSSGTECRRPLHALLAEVVSHHAALPSAPASIQPQAQQHHGHGHGHGQCQRALAISWAMLWGMEVERNTEPTPCAVHPAPQILSSLETAIIANQHVVTSEDLASMHGVYAAMLKYHSTAAAASFLRIVVGTCSTPSHRHRHASYSAQSQASNLFEAVTNTSKGRSFRHMKHGRHRRDVREATGNFIDRKRWEGWATSVASGMADTRARTALLLALRDLMQVPAPVEPAEVPLDCLTPPTLDPFDREVDSLMKECPVLLHLLVAAVKVPDEYAIAAPLVASLLRAQHAECVRLQKIHKSLDPRVFQVLDVIFSMLRLSGRLGEDMEKMSVVWRRFPVKHLANILAVLYARLFSAKQPRATDETAVLLKPFVTQLDRLGVFVPELFSQDDRAMQLD
ncbi:hypothetical protein PTSG_01397 [Salpingoeca rosetta]|uniref:Uncharacterized protein n=1 Tax=Salpingoeca rosetta (strain ATCC 50818 / BSB-021) TaxID=946362 RepID=F2U080_SALR5|nr:uncharacterized protein PTSG_01397 [Salpingoeca rosetta]EGD80808.1 hypothetical protein PTSG_01397 [Salpingoeca rosetta]|eukprot:XP_004997369.1 hypothetical protein PTSG_01397 [Salpingoeca rosetta]